VCPNIEESSAQNVLEVVKSSRVTTWLLEKVFTNEKHRITIIARHFSQINSRLLQIGTFDTLIELQAPSKEQRYELLKTEIAAHLASKELQLQKMAQQTEYFLAKDLFYLWENRDHQDFTQLV
jgi:ATP-dependent 26S proteasome regulatory subunit